MVNLTELVRLSKIPDIKVNELFKGGLYRAMTGRIDLDLYDSSFFMRPEEIDIVHAVVQKMQARYNKPGDPYTDYYTPCFEKINASYASKDREQFEDDIRFLLISIAWD